MASSSSPPSWVLLSRIVAVDAAVGQGSGGDVDFSTLPPSRIARVTIRRCLLEEPITHREPNNPSVLAVDPSGDLLLIHVILRRATCSLPFIVNIPHRRRLVRTTGFAASYIVVDKTTKTAYPLPQAGILEQPARVGILYSPSDAGRFVVTELKVTNGKDVVLICFHSDVGQWTSKCVGSPIPRGQFNHDCVLSYRGRLWWVDLSCGLINLDPFDKQPVLLFVKFPPGTACAWAPELDNHRCVRVSDGRLRFVDMGDKNRDLQGFRKVSVWTLQDDQEWSLQYEASFYMIWQHKSYMTNRLPKKMPSLAFVHPIKPCIVYFYLDNHIFGIDLSYIHPGIVECDDYQPIAPSHVSSRFFHAWADSKREGRAGGLHILPQFLQGLYLDQKFNGLYGQYLDRGHMAVEEVSAYSRENGQTIACASKALKNWNNSHSTTYEVDMSEHMDSNAFEGGCEFGVVQSYFHTNFCGKTSGGQKQIFFAELNGEKGPDNITIVTPLGLDESEVAENSEEHICRCCTGLMHPRSSSFMC